MLHVRSPGRYLDNRRLGSRQGAELALETRVRLKFVVTHRTDCDKGVVMAGVRQAGVAGEWHFRSVPMETAGLDHVCA